MDNFFFVSKSKDEDVDMELLGSFQINDTLPPERFDNSNCNSDCDNSPPEGSLLFGEGIPSVEDTRGMFEPENFLSVSPAPLESSFVLGAECLVYLPSTPYIFGTSATAPDVSIGLGNRKIPRDIVLIAEFLKEHFQLLVKDGDLFMFTGRCWKRFKKDAALPQILGALRKAKLKAPLWRPDLQAILNLLLIDPDLQFEGRFEHPTDSLNLRDGTLNILTGEFYPHTPEDLFTFFVNVSYQDILNASGQNSRFEMFADRAGNGYPEIRQQLLELTAQAVLDCGLKNFYVLLGPSHSGKTQFGRFLMELVGEEDTECVRDAADFVDRWTVGSLVEKRLATCLDLPKSPLPERAVGILKQFVGDDPVKAEEKYHAPSTAYRKPLLLFAGNHPILLPHMDQETAFLNRMIVIPFSNPCPESEMEVHLYKLLLDEAPYILQQAIEAFREMASRNYQPTRVPIPDEFQTEPGNEAAKEVHDFVRLCCVMEQDSEIETCVLWKSYLDYAKSNGAPSLNQIVFARTLNRVLATHFPQVKALKRVGKSEARGYRGLHLLDRIFSDDC